MIHVFSTPSIIQPSLTKNPHSYPHGKIAKMPIPRNVNRNFFKKWSSEMAYVLGFIFADGYIQINSRGSSYFCFDSTDKEIVLKIRKVLSSNHKIRKRFRSIKNPKWKDSYILQIGGVEFVRDLHKLGVIRNKSLKIAFPKVPPKFLGHFVRGYFDGDGCVHLGRYFRKDRNNWKWQFSVNFTSGSRKFLFGLWKSLKQYVHGGRIGRKTRGYELVFSQNDSIALFKLMYNNTQANLFLSRKLAIFKKAIEIMNLRA